MRRWRLLPLLIGAGAALLVVPGAGAATPRLHVSPLLEASAQDDAAALLSRASLAGRARSYAGLQFASAWATGVTSASIAEVRHTPAGGSVVAPRPTAGTDGPGLPVASTSDLDPRLLRLLTVHYQLERGPQEACAGRPAEVVLARRLDTSVAGRFWLDQDSGLLLRREVYDDAGELVRSSAFTTLEVQPHPAVDVATAAVASGALTDAQVAQLRADWPVPGSLPGGLDLFDARVRTHDGKDVLHLSYSDGLSTVSVFAQPGHLGTEPMGGLHEEQLSGSPVWATSGSPQRVVWSGAGQVFTLLSDAPTAAVTAAVTSLPHDPAPRTGVLARIGRGLARFGSWLNPFD